MWFSLYRWKGVKSCTSAFSGVKSRTWRQSANFYPQWITVQFVSKPGGKKSGVKIRGGGGGGKNSGGGGGGGVKSLGVKSRVTFPSKSVSVKNNILKCQTELPLLFDITFDSMNTYFSGAFQQNMFSILESWVAANNGATCDDRSWYITYIEVPLRLNYPCHSQTL